MALDREQKTAALKRGRDKRSRGRTQWRRWHVVTLIVIGSLILGLVALFRSVPSSTASNSTESTPPEVASARECGVGDVASDRDAAVSEQAVVRQSPASNAPPVVRPGTAPTAKDAAALVTIDGGVPLREMCRSGSHVRVRGLTSDLRWLEGWIAIQDLKSLRLDPRGRRIYGLADIVWQPGSERDKAAIIKVANRILQRDGRCEAIDPDSLLVEGEKGQRRYTISCVGPAGWFPIAFTPADARNGHNFTMAAIDPAAQGSTGALIAKADAIPACTAAIDTQLAQPRSADYRIFSDTTFSNEGARARLTIGFSAKNGFGNEIDQTAECMFEGSDLTSATVIP